MELPKRKSNRLKEYDYSSNAAYFITVCTAGKECLFWEREPAGTENNGLTALGRAARRAVDAIPAHYPGVEVAHAAIMPNHVHLLLLLPGTGGTPTVSGIVNQLKGYVTKQAGRPVWQKSFHDHVVRGRPDYMKIWEYIDTNPLKWRQDCYFDGREE